MILNSKPAEVRPPITSISLESDIPEKLETPKYITLPSYNPRKRRQEIITPLQGNPIQQIYKTQQYVQKPQKIINSPYETILEILRNPAVIGVECPGPGKYLLLNRSGLVKPAPISLTKEQIDSIIKNISNQTRIPAIPGLFKAAFDNFIISAVVSDFVGTRFVIQKKNPFQQNFQLG